ncbi:PilZ domain-containing protein [Marinobacteraceae bacterium S3BR75-40.1]
MNARARAFIRHPVDIPITVIPQEGQPHDEGLRNLSLGGLAFSADRAYDAGETVAIHVECGCCAMDVNGRVVWCEENGDHYEVGISFTNPTDAYRMRMVEQICHIEQYRQDVLRQEGRDLSVEEAAHEWIERFAGGFAQEGWHAKP